MTITEQDINEWATRFFSHLLHEHAVQVVKDTLKAYGWVREEV